jgi:hypothetical protein
MMIVKLKVAVHEKKSTSYWRWLFSDPRCWGSMRNCKLNLCHGQQISDFVLDLFAIFEDFSNLPNKSSQPESALANGLISFAVLAEHVVE